ncbi:MAG: response regulator [Ignavibacteria bacterium]|nr:response regulator [Ignavibacteria bacterium]
MEETKNFLVLILDDDDLFRQFAKYVIEKYLGVEVVGIKTPDEGFAFLEKRIPDLILLDMEMPVMDGYSFLRKLRMDTRFDKIRVIPCTAIASKDLFASLLKLGIDDYILKPPTDKVLVSKVKRVVDFVSKKDIDSSGAPDKNSPNSVEK